MKKRVDLGQGEDETTASAMHQPQLSWSRTKARRTTRTCKTDKMRSKQEHDALSYHGVSAKLTADELDHLLITSCRSRCNATRLGCTTGLG